MLSFGPNPIKRIIYYKFATGFLCYAIIKYNAMIILREKMKQGTEVVYIMRTITKVSLNPN